jgi:predicted RNA-binding Zn-ribbon protein involved in translation (DUF1610 family)
MKCPNCQSEQIRERAANLIRNVKRRKRGEKLDPYICDSCEWSGTEEMLAETDTEDDTPSVEHDDPIQW